MEFVARDKWLGLWCQHISSLLKKKKKRPDTQGSPSVVFSQGHRSLQISDHPDAILGRCGVRGNVKKKSATSNIIGKKLCHFKRNIKWQVAHESFVLATCSGYHGACSLKFKPVSGSGLFFLRTPFCGTLFLCFFPVVTNIRLWLAKRD